jgi:hypothetical protein
MRSAGVSPTRRASRATLPARGRDQNGATRRNDRTLKQGEICDFLRFEHAGQSLPLTGRAVREANRVG